MPNAFSQFLARHSEPAITAIIENWERREGIHPAIEASLEERWNALMQASGSLLPVAA
ncbi:MAG: hypothetical protein WDO70_08945 [Alphaproteobacteria bacterium]